MMKPAHFFFSVFILVVVSTAPARAGKVTYAYDSNNRLIQADFSESSIRWKYDRNDNMQFSAAAKQFTWLLFLPTLIRQGAYSPGIPVQENKKIPAVRQSGMKK